MSKINYIHILMIAMLCFSPLLRAQIIEKKITPDDFKERNSDYFGSSLAVSDEYAIVGAMYTGLLSGAAYIFRRDELDWKKETILFPINPEEQDRFGASVSISENYAAISSPGDSTFKGAVYIYRVGDTLNWQLDTVLTASDGNTWEFFGSSVSLSDNNLLVGAHRKNAAYFFKRQNGQWAEKAILRSSDGGDDDFFGYTVSVSDSFALIGAWGVDNSNGASYIFEQKDSKWEEVIKLNSSSGAAGALWGDYALVPTFNYRSNGSTVSVYHRIGESWIKNAELFPSKNAFHGNFGHSRESISLYGKYAVIGDYDDNGATGAAYVFRRHKNNWIELCKLGASDGESLQWFGNVVTISDKYLISSNSEMGSSSAYIYTGYAPLVMTNIDIDSTNRIVPIGGDTIKVYNDLQNLTEKTIRADNWIS